VHQLDRPGNDAAVGIATDGLERTAGLQRLACERVELLAVEDDPGASFFNDTPKYVVSSTLQDAESIWRNSTVLGRYNADAIRDLKAKESGNIYISGSGTLVRALLADGLVDELHLIVYPLTLGAGQRLFADPAKFALAGTEAYESGVLHLTYRPASS
jgi:dihydrofolate reductase